MNSKSKLQFMNSKLKKLNELKKVRQLRDSILKAGNHKLQFVLLNKMPNAKYVSYEFSEDETYFKVFKVVLVLENGETYIKSGPSSFNDLAQIAYFSYIKELNSKKDRLYKK